MSLKTTTIELDSDDRDFIMDHIEYALSEELIKKLETAQINQQFGTITCVVNKYELDDMIGNLCLESNHNEKRAIQERASDIADILESYEYALDELG